MGFPSALIELFSGLTVQNSSTTLKSLIVLTLKSLSSHARPGRRCSSQFLPYGRGSTSLFLKLDSNKSEPQTSTPLTLSRASCIWRQPTATILIKQLNIVSRSCKPWPTVPKCSPRKSNKKVSAYWPIKCQHVGQKTGKALSYQPIGLRNLLKGWLAWGIGWKQPSKGACSKKILIWASFTTPK